MERRSLVKNSIYSGMKSFLTIAFPLVTLKYASNILGTSVLGNVEFTRSVSNYFILFAGLGIQSLATRNAAAIRDNPAKISEFANSVFSLNVISACISTILLGVLTLLIPGMLRQWPLMLIAAMQIPLSVIGVEWVFYAFEDFEYITKRTLFCQIISICILFLFVHHLQDMYIYAGVLVFAAYGANVVGFLYSKKYVKLKCSFDKAAFHYLKPALVLFLNSIATTIYVNSDITMLGFMCTLDDVGIYSGAVKIYTAIKLVLSVILNAVLPRLTYYVNHNLKKQYILVTSFVINVLITIVFPLIIGVILEGENLLLIISNEEYLEAFPALIILAAAILFSCIAMFCNGTILLPYKRDRIILRSSVLGAAANILLNFIMIPAFGIIGAAVTTLISELIVCSVQVWDAKKRFEFKLKMFRTAIPALTGTVVIAVFVTAIKQVVSDYQLEICISISGSVVLYFIIQLLMKNEVAIVLIQQIRTKINRK